MASQSESSFEQARFGQPKKRRHSAQALDTTPATIQDSWREDFRFSDDLAELERQQRLDHLDSKYSQARQATAPKTDNHRYREDLKPTYFEPAVTPKQEQQYNRLVETCHFQAQRILALEEYVARLQAENETLLQDNRIMAQQIQAAFGDQNDQTGMSAEEEGESRKEAFPKNRYQKIWGKLHLLL